MGFFSPNAVQCQRLHKQLFNIAAAQCNSDMRPIKQNVCLIFINMENKWKTVFPLKMVNGAFLFMAEAKNIISYLQINVIYLHMSLHFFARIFYSARGFSWVLFVHR